MDLDRHAFKAMYCQHLDITQVIDDLSQMATKEHMNP